MKFSWRILKFGLMTFVLLTVYIGASYATASIAYADDFCDFHGRIGYSADGNQHDPDDWAASALTLSQIWATGLQDRLVHFDYNSHWGGGSHQNDSRKVTEGYKSSEQVARRLGGFDLNVFYNAQEDLNGAAESIKRAVNASSVNDPFTLIVAGPMHVAYQGLSRANTSKLKYVTVVSHSTWNNTHSHSTKTWSDIQSLGNGLAATRISDQNSRLGPGPISRFNWLQGISSELNYVYQRLLSYNYLNDGTPTEEAQSRCGYDSNGNPVFPNCTDVSDSGMTYYVITGLGERWQGSQSGTPSDIKELIQNPQNSCGSAPSVPTPTPGSTSSPAATPTSTPSTGSPASAGELIMIDAQGNEIRTLTNDVSINRNSLPSRYSIQYTPQDGVSSSTQVQFHYDGEVQYENSAPFTMFGRSGSGFATRTVSNGSFRFRIKVYDQSGKQEEFQVSYQITGSSNPSPTSTPAATPTPTSTSPSSNGQLTIIDAQGNEIRTFSNGESINRSSLPSSYSIQYTPVNGGGGNIQVQFHYDGEIQYENSAPYAMFGRSGSQFATRTTSNGTYSFRVKVYGQSSKLEDFQVGYQITGSGSSPTTPTSTPTSTPSSSPPAGNGQLTIVDGQGNIIRNLSDGATIPRDSLPAGYSIRYTPQNGGSHTTQVQFHYSGNIQYEDYSPYTLLGRSGSQINTQPTTTGSFSLRIKVYDGGNSTEDFRMSYQVVD